MKKAFAVAFLGLLASTVLCIAVRAAVDRPLPDVFGDVLPEIKAKTRVPILLPSRLPRPFNNAKHASADGTTADEYAIELYYELNVGNAGFAASFGATNNPDYSPQELGNVREVKLAGGITGFFRPVSCGGSCAPASLSWKLGTVLYEIQLKLLSNLPEKNQQGIITSVANSAILAGPR